MENAEFARLLSETADLMEIAGEDSFRIRSYRNAAQALETHPERVEDLLRRGSGSVLDIPGVGKGIAHALEEIAGRGSFERRDEMLAKYPPTVLEMLHIQGVGPKTIARLIELFRVTTLDGLEKLCRDHKLREVPRMGEKTEEKILRSIAAYRQSAGRFLLSFASEAAREFVDYLSAGEGLEHVTPAGSLRRGRETVGDLDLLVSGRNAAAALERFVKHPRVTQVLGHGENKASAKIGVEGLQVDVRALPGESHGAALLYFTGSKTHNVAMRQRALKMGYTLNEYGLFTIEGERRVAGRTEEEVFAKLKLAWIPPELRENQGEIEAAELHGRGAEKHAGLPELVDRAAIRGDLHMHTTESDGRASLEEMATAAKDLGHSYIAITDHSKALAMANGLDEKRVVAFAHRVRKLDARAMGIRVLSGLECDIRRDGTMDIDEDALAELDLVVASVHSYLNLDAAEMTDRLLRALENPHVKILGHPTGRLLLHRDGYSMDFERVAAEAGKRGVAMEINASPERLDLHAPLLRAAKAKGVKFVISTDAHHPRHLANIGFGVTMARRGWLEASDILNTLPAAQFLKALHR